MANNRPMTEDEKKLLQTQHRMEAIEVQTMELDDVKIELKRRLNT